MIAKIFSVLFMFAISSVLLADEGESVMIKEGETVVVVSAAETGRDFDYVQMGVDPKYGPYFAPELDIGYDLELSNGSIINIIIPFMENYKKIGPWVHALPTEFLINIYDTFYIEPGDKLLISTYKKGSTQIKGGSKGFWKEFRITLIRDGSIYYSERGWVKYIKPEVNWLEELNLLDLLSNLLPELH